jgi:hypothetical protein
MGKRHPNHRLVKIHRNYTAEEVAKLFGSHKNTVRNWVKGGLATIDNKRPMLILGHVLIAFLKSRRAKHKQKCRPGELYCVRCRLPRFPAEAMVEYSPVSEKVGNLSGICPDCYSIMNQRVSIARIEEIRGNMDIKFPKGLHHIVKRTKPTLNSDLR